MELKTCATCHKLFKYPGYGYLLCPECKRTDEARFQLVKKFLDQYPGAEGKEVFLATGVSVKTLIKWVRDGRLVSSNAINLGAVCDVCKKPIATGTLCEECKVDVVKKFRQVEEKELKKLEILDPPENKKGKGMHFL